MKRSLPYIFIGFITVMLILFPQNATSYAKNSLDLCYRVIIPSLFPFFVCSGLLISSGVAQSLSKISGPFMRPLFNVGGPGASAFVLGILGGYPLGAVTACQLYESGYLSKTETERLFAFCNTSGPLFILGAIGCALYSSAKIGVVLYISHILSTILVGLLFRFYKKDKHIAPMYPINQSDDGFGQVFSRVLSNSINSILTVCGAIVFFSVVSGIVTEHLPVDHGIKSIIHGILEFSGGTVSINESDFSLPLKLTLSAVCIGFSGICVHLQVASVAAKHHLSIMPYVCGKILHGIFAGFFTFLYLIFNPDIVSVFKNNQTPMSGGFCMSSLYSVINILFFLIMGVLAIMFTYSGLKFSKQQKRDV